MKIKEWGWAGDEKGLYIRLWRKHNGTTMLYFPLIQCGMDLMVALGRYTPDHSTQTFRNADGNWTSQRWVKLNDELVEDYMRMAYNLDPIKRKAK